MSGEQLLNPNSRFYNVSERNPHNYAVQDGEPDTLQRDWELHALLDIFKKERPRNVLEVGSYRGGMLLQFMKASDPGVCFASVDFLFQQAAADVWCKTYGHECSVWNGNSRHHEIIQSVTEYMPEIDFLFIDGGHDYETVKADFCNYGPFVRKGGIIGLHDIIHSKKCPELEVWRLWDDIREAGYMTQELVTRRDADSGGIGLIFV